MSRLGLGLLLALSMLIPAPAQGQVLLGILFGKLASEKFHIGLTVGPNFANISGIDGTNVRAGLALGLLGEWRIAEHLYCSPSYSRSTRWGPTTCPWRS